MKRGWILLFLAICGCTSYPETTQPSADIDRFATTVLREIPELPSAGIAVVANDRVVYLKNAGTPYYIGSTTKAYTGLAMAVLAQRGLVDLDAPVSKYLRTTNNVTLRAFLTHTSGIENNPIGFRTAYTGQHSHDDLVALLDHSKPLPKPGFVYDNLGYVVASLVIEEITHKPWQQELDALVFRPLRMAHTTAYMSQAKTWGPLQPYWLDRSGEIVPLKFEKSDETMHAAGGIVTTPADLARWLKANLARDHGIPAAAFAEAQKREVETPITRGEFQGDAYAFGWYHGDLHGEHVLFHAGGYEGWRSFFAMMPEKHIGAGAMTNINGTMSAGLDLIVAYALDRLSGKTNIDADYAKRLADLKQRVATSREKMLADVANRAKRPWSLAHPNSAYVGQYVNPGLGTLTIEERNGKLYATIGRLTSVLEAYVKPESARVEMVPASGEPFFFQWSNGDKPDAVLWDTDPFTRQK